MCLTPFRASFSGKLAAHLEEDETLNEQNAKLYPVAGVQVKVETKQRIVVVQLPYFTDFGLPEQQEHQERAYCMLPEQAAILRDSLTEALNRLG